MDLLGVPASPEDRVLVREVKAKEGLVHLRELLVKVGFEVGRGEARLKHAALPRKSGEIGLQLVQAARGVLLAQQLGHALAGKGPLLGARHGQQAARCELAGLHQAVHALAEDVQAAKRPRGLLELLHEPHGATVLLLCLPGRQELQQGAQAAQPHAEGAQGNGVVRALAQLREEVLELGRHLGHLALRHGGGVPRNGVGPGDEPLHAAAAGEVARQVNGHRGALAKRQAAARELGRSHVHEGHVPHGNNNGSLGVGQLGQKRRQVLTVQALMHGNVLGARGVADGLRGLQRAYRRAAPDLQLRVFSQQGKRARIRRGKGPDARGREPAVLVQAGCGHVLGASMTNEHQRLDHASP